MPTPHKWAKEIKAWADGANIEVRDIKAPVPYNAWIIADNPAWLTDDAFEYRVQPEKKSPGEVFFEVAFPQDNWEKITCKNFYNKASIAVIEAYKRGELDYD